MTKTRTRDRGLPQLGAVTPIPSQLAELVPEPVRDASEAFRQAEDELAAARARARDAAGVADGAVWEDKMSTRDALRAGGDPPAPTAPEARANQERYEAEVPEREVLAREALAAYLAEVEGHRKAMVEAAAEHERELAGQLQRRVDEIEAGLLELKTVRLLRAELRPGGGAGRYPAFSPRALTKLGRADATTLVALRVSVQSANGKRR